MREKMGKSEKTISQQNEEVEVIKIKQLKEIKMKEK